MVMMPKKRVLSHVVDERVSRHNLPLYRATYIWCRGLSGHAEHARERSSPPPVEGLSHEELVHTGNVLDALGGEPLVLLRDNAGKTRPFF
jgi:hypothetical protein